MKSKLKPNVRSLLSWGWNCTEIAVFLDTYSSAIRRIKLQLKKECPVQLYKEKKRG